MALPRTCTANETGQRQRQNDIIQILFDELHHVDAHTMHTLAHSSYTHAIVRAHAVRNKM